MLPRTEAGEGAVVVLLHAGIADRTMWNDDVPLLAAAGYRVLAFDLPGFGDAPLQSGETAPWTDVLAELTHLGIDRFAVVGNSFGGAVALRIAALAPGRVWALVSVSAPVPGIEPSMPLAIAWAEEEEALERGDVEGAIHSVVETWTLPEAAPSLQDQIAAMQRRAMALQAAAPADAVDGPDPLEDPAALAGITTPTLAIAGDRELPDFPDGARALAEALPDARLAIIHGAGHLAPLEAPDEFRALITPFLAEHRPA